MENTREIIISSAFSFYSKPVIKSVSLSAIASKAGITKPAIYRHFKNRQELDEVMLDRVFGDLYSILAKIHPEKECNVSSFVEDILILLLTHKEYFFYLISTQVDFALDKVLLRFKKMGLSFFDKVFATDGSVTDMERYKNAIYLGGNIMFFVVARCRLALKMGLSDSYSDVVEYASKINGFLGTGLGQDVSSLTVSRMAKLDEICRANMESVKPVSNVFHSVSEIVKEKGLQGITVESVAKGIGLAKSSIYDRYESKTQMIGSLICEEFEDMYRVIENNMPAAATNAERGYVVMETFLLYFMKKPEVLTVGRWFQFHSVDEVLHMEKYEEQIYRQYFEKINLFDDSFPDWGLPGEDKRLVNSWFMMMPVVLFMHTKNQKISPEITQAMLKDILIMMETGMGDRK